MKRIYLTLLIILLIACSTFTGCANNKPTTNNSQESTSSSEISAAVEPVTLRVSLGTNNPFGFLNEQEKPDGFVVDVWNEIGKRTGYTIDL